MPATVSVAVLGDRDRGSDVPAAKRTNIKASMVPREGKGNAAGTRISTEDSSLSVGSA